MRRRTALAVLVVALAGCAGAGPTAEIDDGARDARQVAERFVAGR